MEGAIRAIRLIGGEGPFRGESDKLTTSIDRLSRNCLQLNKSAGSFESLLATFLALSFCDTSTAEDHERLFSQLQDCSRRLQSRVNDMLAAHELASLVTPEDVQQAFRVYERLFQEYIDDPLWPPFKFPWTRDEEARLDGKLRLRLMQLDPVFDEMFLKVKYGGASAELKDKTVHAISMAAQELLPQAAFLRAPPYPGVSSQYPAAAALGCIKGSLPRGQSAHGEVSRDEVFPRGPRLEDVVAA